MLNRESKPAVTKLLMLPTSTRVLSNHHHQKEFLDEGVLCALKKWLDSLPDGCLPHSHICNGVLKVLQDLPIGIETAEKASAHTHSKIGHAIMLMAKSEEEVTENRRIAEKLAKKWSGEDDHPDEGASKAHLRDYLSLDDRKILLRDNGRELFSRGGGNRGGRGYRVRPQSNVIRLHLRAM